MPFAMRSVDFCLFHLFIFCHARDMNQDFYILDKCSVTELYPKSYCNVSKLWLTRGTQ